MKSKAVLLLNHFFVAPLFVGIWCWVLLCFAISCVLSSFAIILLLGKRELVALLLLCSECHVAVIVRGLFLRLFLAVPCAVL